MLRGRIGWRVARVARWGFWISQRRARRRSGLIRPVCVGILCAQGEVLMLFAARDTDSSVASSLTVQPGMRDTLHPSSQSGRPSSPASSPDIHEHTATERTPLLSAISENHHLQGTHSHGKPRTSPDSQQKRLPAFHNARENVHSAYVSLRKATWRDVGQQVFVEPVKLLPATILGCLLNVLDGVSYGMIMYVACVRGWLWKAYRWVF